MGEGQTPYIQPSSPMDLLGIEVPPGTVMAVFRNGVFQKAIKPGHAWPFRDYLPLLDTFAFIDTHSRRYQMRFEGVYSADRVALDITLAVEYSFDPSDLPRDVAAEMLRFSERDRYSIVYVRMQRALRELVGITPAEALYLNPAAANLEPDIYTRIYRYLGERGVKLDDSDAIMITEVRHTEEQPAAGAAPQAAVHPPTPQGAPTETAQDDAADEMRELPPRPDRPPEHDIPALHRQRPQVIRRFLRRRTPPGRSGSSEE